MVERPYREIRAQQTADTLTVYQAYRSEIAEAATAAQTFVAPFKRDRMTWVKPSFLWMMYRSGWGRKDGQEHVLAVEITRTGFEWALAHSSLSHFEPDAFATEADWREQKDASPVRVQWDPERSLRLEPLGWRSLQVGLGGEAVRRYVDEWIVGITDVSPLAHRVADLVAANDLPNARALLPNEEPYTLAQPIARRIGMRSD